MFHDFLPHYYASILCFIVLCYLHMPFLTGFFTCVACLLCSTSSSLDSLMPHSRAFSLYLLVHNILKA